MKPWKGSEVVDGLLNSAGVTSLATNRTGNVTSWTSLLALIPIRDIPDPKPTSQAMPPNNLYALIPFISRYITM
jgi:hypothetical protein